MDQPVASTQAALASKFADNRDYSQDWQLAPKWSAPDTLHTPPQDESFDSVAVERSDPFLVSEVLNFRHTY